MAQNWAHSVKISFPKDCMDSGCKIQQAKTAIMPTKDIGTKDIRASCLRLKEAIFLQNNIFTIRDAKLRRKSMINGMSGLSQSFKNIQDKGRDDNIKVPVIKVIFFILPDASTLTEKGFEIIIKMVVGNIHLTKLIVASGYFTSQTSNKLDMLKKIGAAINNNR